MKPTEHEGTVAVDAAARRLYDDGIENLHKGFAEDGDPDAHARVFPAFEDLEPMAQNPYREAVLRPVWAALEALPDRAVAERERIAAGIEDSACGCYDTDDDDDDQHMEVCRAAVADAVRIARHGLL